MALLCKVCFTNPLRVKLGPCNHAIACQDCTDAVLARAEARGVSPRCPFCREVIAETTPVFIT